MSGCRMGMRSVAVVCLVLAGCGGGGDSPPASEYQVGAAFTRLATTTSPIYAAKGQVQGVDATLRVMIRPVPAQTFNGQLREAFRVDQAVATNVGATPTESSTLYYSRSPFTLHGVNDSGLLVVPQGTPSAVPAVANPGQGGRLFVGTVQETPPSTTTVDWTLEPNNDRSAHLCLQFGFGSDGFDKYCFTIFPDGGTTGGFQAVTLRDGVTIHFQ